MIGELCDGYFVLVDYLGAELSKYALIVVNFLVTPLNWVAVQLADAINSLNDLVNGFIGTAKYVIIAITTLIGGIPDFVKGLITLALILDILILGLRGRFGNA